MKLLSRIFALIGAATFLTTALAVGPATAAMKMKPSGGMTAVHGYTKKTKSGKIVKVNGYLRKAPAKRKMVAVHSHVRVLKSGKVIAVKGHMRSMPGKKGHKAGAHM